MRQPITTTSYADAVSWTLTGGLAIACVIMTIATRFDVLPGRAILPGLGVAALAGALAIGRLRADARLVAGATAFLQMTLFTMLGVMLTYLLASRAGQLWDAWLATADERLGLDWPLILAAADRMPAALLAVGGVAYYSLVAQMVLSIVLLAAGGYLDRLRMTMAAAIASGVATVLLSGAMPAIGNLFDPDQYDRLWPSVAWLERPLVLGLREGSVRRIDLSHMSGIVSFPSYHATLPVILVWGLRPFVRLRVPATIWAGLTIMATPLFGGHYVVDVLGGLVLAFAALAIIVRLPSSGVASDGMRLPRTCGIHISSTARPKHGGSKNGSLDP